MLKRVVRAVLGNYELYRIYRSPQLQAPRNTTTGSSSFDIVEIHLSRDCAESESEDLRALGTFCGAESLELGLRRDLRLVSGAAVWYGERYRQSRGFWPLQHDEAKLVHIATAAEYRGQGLAPILVEALERRLAERGFGRLYARIWHNNGSSMRALTKIGWVEIAFVIVCHPLGFGRELRVQIPRGRSRQEPLELGS